MALIHCLKCGGTVSTKALACPHCNVAPSQSVQPETAKGRSTKPPWSKIGKIVAVTLGALYFSVGVWWRIGNYLEHRHQQEDILVAAGLEARIETHWYRGDDICLWNKSTVEMTDVSVIVGLIQSGQQVSAKTVEYPSIAAGSKHVWSNALSVPRGEIGTGTYLTVNCKELLSPRSFTY